MRTHRTALTAALCVWLLSSFVVKASLTNTDDLPRIQPADLIYLGGFRLPSQTVNGDDFSFGGQPIAFNPATNSLFVGSYRGNVAEVTIPSPVNTSNVNAMPFATFLQPFADPTEGHLADVVSGGGAGLSGLMVYGNRLYGTANIFYDANNIQRVSHFSRSLQLNQSSFSGWSSVWQADHSGFVSGWMATVPSEWHAALGAPALTGQCCVPIVWRTSTGPAAIGFNPAQIGQASVGGVPLLYYGIAHPTLGPWDGSNPTYGATTLMGGMAVIAGTRTVLFVGSNGTGPHCYGNGTSDQSLDRKAGSDGETWCYDPTSSDKGSHAYPYNYQVWAYDLNDLAAVKAGSKQPWDVLPYAVWPLSFPTPERTVRIGGVAYDAQRQLLYVSQHGADVDGYASRSVIHVFRLSATPGATAAPAANTVSSVTITPDRAAPQAPGTAITLTAQPTGGTAPYQYKWFVFDGVTTTIAADWTASNRFTWTPATANANYRISVWVRSAGSTADVLEAATNTSFAIATPSTAAATSITMAANRVAPQPAFTAITWTATPVGGVAPHQYKWFVTDGTATTVAANWSTTNTFIWTPATANANYHVVVWVRSAGNVAEQAEATGDNAFSVSAPLPGQSGNGVTLTSDKLSPQPAGTLITFTAEPLTGVAPYQYQWSVFNSGEWMVAGWTSLSRFTWFNSTPGSDYQVSVRVRSASSADGEATATVSYVLTGSSVGSTPPVTPPVTTPPVTTPPVTTPPVTTPPVTTPPVTTPPVTTPPVTTPPVTTPPVTTPPVTTPPVTTPPVTTPPVTTQPTDQTVSGVTLTSDKPSPQAAGTILRFTAQPLDGVAPYQYQWSVFETGEWLVGGWTSQNNLIWLSGTPGPYQISVRVRSAGSTSDQGEATATLSFVLTSGR